MPDMRKGKKADTGFDHDGVLGSIGRGVGSIVRDAGEVGRSSLRALEARWAQAGRLGTRCVNTGVGVSIRVPSIGGEEQLVCPTNPDERCDGCILDKAFVPGFSMDDLGHCFAKAAGKTVGIDD